MRTAFSRRRARFGGARLRESGRFLPVLCAFVRSTSDAPVAVPRASRRDFARDDASGFGRDRFASARRENVRGSAIRGVSADSSVPLASCRGALASVTGPTVAMPLRQRYVVAPTRSRVLVVHSGTHAGARSFDRCSSDGAFARADPPELHHANVSRRSRRGPVWKGERRCRFHRLTGGRAATVGRRRVEGPSRVAARRAFTPAHHSRTPHVTRASIPFRESDRSSENDHRARRTEIFRVRHRHGRLRRTCREPR